MPLIEVTTSLPEASSALNAEVSDLITGTGLSGVGINSWLEGAPPVNCTNATPVRPSRPSLARVSTLMGVSAATWICAITLRGSLGSSFNWLTSPIWMPLYWTGLPFERPVTASVNTMS